jgi:hypothetical protein
MNSAAHVIESQITAIEIQNPQFEISTAISLIDWFEDTHNN